ncbi:NmrA family protein [Colletotrichum karsti]|uniref:NmrA family protein n=1 Tax=Colletotrichum karsti TaxID=1095194 RepID=A0A9P6LEF8_9PEZI|nr:NmrA family protein [Colletotrichum karsti]KAF9873119.1 NmrA family protein [Colletotrichum karsti]
MAGSKILVLGGTGPAGICLLRELIHRGHATVVFARNPAKIPHDLASSPLIEVVKGEMSDSTALSSAMAQCSVVISLLGPDINNTKIDPSLFADIYRSYVFPSMRKHGVRRILAMGTLSIKKSEDHWTMFQTMVTTFMCLFASAIYGNMLNLAKAFENEADGLDWTVFRIAQIPGESDEEGWRKDREEQLFTGWIGESGWTSSMKRGALAKWLADAAEGKADGWIGKMPALSSSAPK